MIYKFDKNLILPYLRQSNKTQNQVILESYNIILKYYKNPKCSTRQTSLLLKNIIFTLIRERRKHNYYESLNAVDISLELYFMLGLKNLNVQDFNLEPNQLVDKLLNEIPENDLKQKIHISLSRIMSSMPNDVRDSTTPQHKQKILNYIMKVANDNLVENFNDLQVNNTKLDLNAYQVSVNNNNTNLNTNNVINDISNYQADDHNDNLYANYIEKNPIFVKGQEDGKTYFLDKSSNVLTEVDLSKLNDVKNQIKLNEFEKLLKQNYNFNQNQINSIFDLQNNIVEEEDPQNINNVNNNVNNNVINNNLNNSINNNIKNLNNVVNNNLTNQEENVLDNNQNILEEEEDNNLIDNILVKEEEETVPIENNLNNNSMNNNANNNNINILLDTDNIFQGKHKDLHISLIAITSLLFLLLAAIIIVYIYKKKKLKN